MVKEDIYSGEPVGWGPRELEGFERYDLGEGRERQTFYVNVVKDGEELDVEISEVHHVVSFLGENGSIVVRPITGDIVKRTILRGYAEKSGSDKKNAKFLKKESRDGEVSRSRIRGFL